MASAVQGLVGQRVVGPLAWKADDAVLFAAAVGADPSTDLDYLDLSRGPVVLPTFLGARVSRSGQEDVAFQMGEVYGDRENTFLLGCDISILSETPSAAQTDYVNEYLEVWDKGSSALLVNEVSIEVDGKPVVAVRTTTMVRGGGGFGGERGPSRIVPRELVAAVELPVSIPANSAVLYQLVGEHNPHSLDPEFAAKVGLAGPIAAGQVLIGAAARTLTAAFADGDHRALGRIGVDYAGSYVTGQPLTMQAQQLSSNTFAFNLHSGQQPILLGGHAELT